MLTRENKQLMWWFFLYFICGRIYHLADSYLFTKIYHVIGVSFENIAVIYRLAYKNSVVDGCEKLFWKLFLPYQVACVSFFTYIQFTEDHKTREIVWNSGHKWSGAMAKSILLGIFQEATILGIGGIIFYFIWKRAVLNIKDGA